MGSCQKNIHNRARNLMGQLSVQWFRYLEAPREYLAFRLWSNHGHSIKKIISHWKDETLGSVAACGLGEEDTSGNYKLCDVVQTFPSVKSSGRGLLIEVATRAIVAAMADVVWAELKREDAAKNFVEPKSPYGFWATRHSGM